MMLRVKASPPSPSNANSKHANKAFQPMAHISNLQNDRVTDPRASTNPPQASTIPKLETEKDRAQARTQPQVVLRHTVRAMRTGSRAGGAVTRGSTGRVGSLRDGLGV